MKKWITLAAITAVVISAAWFYQRKGAEDLSVGSAPSITPEKDATREQPVMAKKKDSTSPNIQALAKPAKITPEDIRLVKTLNEILASKNDNDPRLDQSFNHLSSGARYLMEKRFYETPAEKLNEKGTIVFLLGNHLESGADIDFLGKVLEEPVCRSLEDCNKDANSADAEGAGAHQEVGIEVTLAYPKLMSIKKMESYLAKPNSEQSHEIQERILNLLQKQMESPIPAVRRSAERVLQQYGPR